MLSIKKIIASAITCLSLTGCLSTQNIDKNKPVTLKANEGIAIIGLDQGAGGLFYMGDFANDKFTPDGFMPKGISLASGEPYIVQKALATTETRRYGMESINIGSEIFGFACGQELPVLSLNAGKIQYYGDFSLEKKDGKLVVRHTFNIEKAQNYINQHYPNQHWTLAKGKVITSKKHDCVAPISLPIIIYIYR